MRLAGKLVRHWKSGTLFSTVAARVRWIFRRRTDRFLSRVCGVVHVGANTGQERGLYDAHGINVLWIEPIPDAYEQLKANIAPFPRQRAIQALITDVDGANFDFHVANNGGQSSSILQLKGHRDIWPDVAFSETLVLESRTLPTVLSEIEGAKALYDALVLDTQGSELLVLKGAASVISQFKFVKTEVADFEAYEGCCRVRDIEAFMVLHGFREYRRVRFAGMEAQGSYYDIVYRRCD